MIQKISIMRKVWEDCEKSMTRVWQEYDKSMRRVSEEYEKSMMEEHTPYTPKAEAVGPKAFRYQLTMPMAAGKQLHKSDLKKLWFIKKVWCRGLDVKYQTWEKYEKIVRKVWEDCEKSIRRV